MQKIQSTATWTRATDPFTIFSALSRCDRSFLIEHFQESDNHSLSYSARLAAGTHDQDYDQIRKPSHCSLIVPATDHRYRTITGTRPGDDHQ